MARQGKIARLPNALREQVNQRLLDGESAATLLDWLNAQPAAVVIWKAHFDGIGANADNLTNWRQGGYQEWVSRQERTENMKTLSRFAVDLARSGSGIADGAAAIIGGHILEALETMGNVAITGGAEDANADPMDGLTKMAKAVASLQTAGTAREKLALEKRKAAGKDEDRKLAREKFETSTVEKFLKFAQTKEAQDVLNSDAKKSVKVAELRKIIFGTRPQA